LRDYTVYAPCFKMKKMENFPHSRLPKFRWIPVGVTRFLTLILGR
jgi:hypothetical protein